MYIYIFSSPSKKGRENEKLFILSPQNNGRENKTFFIFSFAWSGKKKFYFLTPVMKIKCFVFALSHLVHRNSVRNISQKCVLPVNFNTPSNIFQIILNLISFVRSCQTMRALRIRTG